MHGSVNDIPVTLEVPEVVIQEIEWGDMHIGFETYHQPFDIAPLLKGLPDDRCQCPHWGYVISGEMRVRYAGREEVVKAGEAYYLAPGHAPIIAAGTRVIEFSPIAPYQVTAETVMRNFEAIQQA